MLSLKREMRCRWWLETRVNLWDGWTPADPMPVVASPADLSEAVRSFLAREVTPW